MRATNRRMKLFLCVFGAACLAHYIPEQVAFAHPVGEQIWALCFVYSVVIPIGVSQLCATLIFLSHELFLQKLTRRLSVARASEIEFDWPYICEAYKRRVVHFEKECAFWRIYFGLKVFGFFTLIWLYASTLIHQDVDVPLLVFLIAGIVLWLSPLVELVAASSRLSCAHHSFSEQLLRVQSEQLTHVVRDTSPATHSRNMHQCHHLYSYVCAHRMTFHLFGSELNASNALKLSAFFVIAKMISYSIYNI